MSEPFRFLVAESEAPEEREARRRSVGSSSGETYVESLLSLAPGAICDQIKPAEEDSPRQEPEVLRRYDAVFLCGSPMHVYEDSPQARRALDFMRTVFAAGTPAFGSCAGLQLAVVAAGGQVGPRKDGKEAGFARCIALTEKGREHPLLSGRPLAYDAPSVHSDEVKQLPPGATLLATNETSPVQAAEIRCGDGIFWGVQYHPEISLHEVAEALRRQAESLVKDGLAADRLAVDRYADQIEALAREPARHDLAWQLGLNHQVTDPALRQVELRNFIRHLAEPRRARRNAA
ncbi:type 1 glutamine amidotransferase [Roseomonas chloroacetimidivorans]|jgi:GMP synthase (glutamine-hydrolysing)|uniref:type 1 glutamine amidotransferase n=1 Tax=Roseomonas chloroacetimidivorans TaxID=1766656 RepID=UPI003C773B46